MSVPSKELMSLMSGGGGESAAPGAGPMDAAAKSNTPPGGGPMTTPQPKEGQKQAAMVNVSMVFQLLESSLGAFGSQTEEGKAILSALQTLTKKFGQDRQKADQLVPAELMQLMAASGAGAGGGSPAAKAMGGMPPTQPAVPQGAPQ